MQNGKKYRAVLEKVTQESYSLAEASALVKETSTTKFDSTVEVHFNLGIDPKKAEQQLRTTVSLPNGTGKTKKVVVFVSDELVKEATDAGAIEAGNVTLIEKIKKGWTDFDIAIAHPDMMREVAKIGKILGTKGLMPNPKAGTVSPQIAKTVKEVMGGRIELKADPKGIVHAVAGKVSFDAVKIEENLKAIIEVIRNHKPNSLKGTYVKSMSISSSMGPGINVNTDEVK